MQELERFEDRLDRLESIEAIRQLAARYAVAVDMRDMDAIVNLYLPDVSLGSGVRGRQALKAVFDHVLRSFRASVHDVGTHVIEFTDRDNAQGILYCRCEHEIAGKWVPVQLYYLDFYRREGGQWYIRRRVPSELYGADALERPQPGRVRWPDSPDRPGHWHKHFPSWAEFWEDTEGGTAPVRPAAPEGGFIDGLRRGDRRLFPIDFNFAKAGR